MRNLARITMWFTLLLLFCACQKQEPAGAGKKHAKLAVLTTLFPLYDFARNIGGDQVEVSLLLPPGVEAHSFEPKPSDAVKVSGADVFIFTSERMEPWVPGFLQGVGSRSSAVVDASKGVKLLTPAQELGEGEHEHRPTPGHQHRGGLDPHVWLDFDNAQLMVDNIAQALAAKDPAHADNYRANAEAYKAKLRRLDAAYREGLKDCARRTFLHGGHYAFGYLAKRYNLQYLSASAFNAEAEPSPAKLVQLVKELRAMQVQYIYTEELVSPRVSEMLARETGAKVLMLHGAHNIGKDDLSNGVSFISLMERNLASLRLGLGCK